MPRPVHWSIVLVISVLQSLWYFCIGNDFRSHGPVSWTAPLSTAQFRAHRLPEISVPGDPFVSLEHVNIALKRSDWDDDFDSFWVRGLGFVYDPRAADVLNTTNSAGGNAAGLVWLNGGLQQLHIPLTPDAPNEIVRGSIGLVYSADEAGNLKRRLRSAGVVFSEEVPTRQHSSAMWRIQPNSTGPVVALRLVCPSGNKVRIHFAEPHSPEHTLLGPAAKLHASAPVPSTENTHSSVDASSGTESSTDNTHTDAMDGKDVPQDIGGSGNSNNSSTRGSLGGCGTPASEFAAAAVEVDSDSTAVSLLPGGRSVGLGMAYVQFDVPAGTAKRIGRFYQHFFGANTELRPVGHTVKIDAAGDTAAATTAAAAAAVVDDATEATMEQDGIAEVEAQLQQGLLELRVAVGYHQYLLFQETNDPKLLVPYDGHHIAVYTNRFVPQYRALKRAKLVWNNPKFPQFRYDSLDEVLKHNEYRFRYITDVESGDVVFELEHEIRSLLHPGFSCKDWLAIPNPKQ